MGAYGRLSSLYVSLAVLVLLATTAFGQASYTAQVRGVVKDQSGAVVTQASITITNDATGIGTTAKTDEHGLYVLTGLRPAVYTIKAEGTGFRAAEQKNVVLQVDQQTSIDFTLHPLGVITTVEVTTDARCQSSRLDTRSVATEEQGERDVPCRELAHGNVILLRFVLDFGDKRK